MESDNNYVFENLDFSQIDNKEFNNVIEKKQSNVNAKLIIVNVMDQNNYNEDIKTYLKNNSLNEEYFDKYYKQHIESFRKTCNNIFSYILNDVFNDFMNNKSNNITIDYTKILKFFDKIVGYLKSNNNVNFNKLKEKIYIVSVYKYFTEILRLRCREGSFMNNVFNCVNNSFENKNIQHSQFLQCYDCCLKQIDIFFYCYFEFGKFIKKQGVVKSEIDDLLESLNNIDEKQEHKKTKHKKKKNKKKADKNNLNSINIKTIKDEDKKEVEQKKQEEKYNNLINKINIKEDDKIKQENIKKGNGRMSVKKQNIINGIIGYNDLTNKTIDGSIVFNTHKNIISNDKNNFTRNKSLAILNYKFNKINIDEIYHNLKYKKEDLEKKNKTELAKIYTSAERSYNKISNLDKTFTKKDNKCAMNIIQINHLNNNTDIANKIIEEENENEFNKQTKQEIRKLGNFIKIDSYKDVLNKYSKIKEKEFEKKINEANNRRDAVKLKIIKEENDDNEIKNKSINISKENINNKIKNNGL